MGGRSGICEGVIDLRVWFFGVESERGGVDGVLNVNGRLRVLGRDQCC